MPEQQNPRRLARDNSGRVGEVMERRTVNNQERVWLRPVGGGLEWDVLASQVEPVTDEESVQ